MFANIDEFDQHCFDNAAYFTAVRGRSPFDRIKKQFSSYEEAKTFAAQFNDGRTMIYAVTAKGRFGHICNA
jgi:hypothetical protein